MAPVVLVTADRTPAHHGSFGLRVRPRSARVTLEEPYTEAVRLAGGLPLVVPPAALDIDQLLALADAVVLTGGHFDIHPSHYGEEVAARLDRVEAQRTALELELARACLARQVPVLGVCGGMQALAVAAGGRLVQHLVAPWEGGTGLEHEQPTSPAEPWHPVRWEGRHGWAPGSVLSVNSTHHQAVSDPGRGLRACGWAPDGVVEGIEGEEGFVLGVQWHPERLGDLAPYRALLAATAG